MMTTLAEERREEALSFSTYIIVLDDNKVLSLLDLEVNVEVCRPT